MNTRRVLAALALPLVALALSACGGDEAPTSPVAERTVPVATTAPETPSAAVTDAPVVRTAQVGRSVLVDGTSLKMTALASGDYAFEVYTDELVTFDGSYTATDSAGVEHVGTPKLPVFSANGVGGNLVGFDTTNVVSITYTATDGATITWTVA